MTQDATEQMWEAVRAIVAQLRDSRISRDDAEERLRACGVSSTSIPFILMNASRVSRHTGLQAA